jgi:hypothetical protein
VCPTARDYRDNTDTGVREREREERKRERQRERERGKEGEREGEGGGGRGATSATRSQPFSMRAANSFHSMTSSGGRSRSRTFGCANSDGGTSAMKKKEKKRKGFSDGVPTFVFPTMIYIYIYIYIYI